MNWEPFTGDKEELRTRLPCLCVTHMRVATLFVVDMLPDGELIEDSEGYTGWEAQNVACTLQIPPIPEDI